MRKHTILFLIMAVLLAGCAPAPSTPTPMLLVPAPAERATPKPTERPAPTPVEKPTLTPTPTPTREPTPTPTPTEKPPTPAPQVREIGEFTEEDRVLAEAQIEQAREFVYQKAKELGIEAPQFTILSVRNDKGVFTYIQSPQRERFQGKEVDVWYAWTPKGIVKPPLTAPSWKNAVRDWNDEELRLEYVEYFNRIALGFLPYKITRAVFNPEKGEVENIVTLRSLAEKKNFKIGTALHLGYMDSECPFNGLYNEIAAREFNLFTPICSTWDQRPGRNEFNFAYYDIFTAFAERHGMEIFFPALAHYHYKHVPEWLAGGNFSQEEVIEILRDHVTTFVKRYRGQVDVFQVVGEPVWGESEPYLGGFWTEKIGPEYIEMAFRWAREAAGPGIKLFINEGDGVEATGPWSEANHGRRSEFFYNLVKGLVEKGVPIDGVGLQMHVGIKGCPRNPEWGNVQECPPFEEIEAAIARFAKLGLEVRITEMDVIIGHPPPYTEEELREQAEIYRNILQICLDSPACTALTTWGVTDKDTWQRSYLKQKGESPLLFDEEGNPKPAYWAVFDVLSRR